MERDFRSLFLACMGDKDSTAPIKNREQKAFTSLENEKVFIILGWFSKMLVLLAAVL
jgi:hypothetical protein